MKSIDWLEIQANDSENSCWIVIKDNVYNVTNFLQKHPGGETILLKYAGKDATKAFTNVGHS